MFWTRISHLRGLGLTPSQSTKTLPDTGLGRKGRKKMDRTLQEMVKANLKRQNHTKKHTHTHSQKEQKGKKKLKNKNNKINK